MNLLTSKNSWLLAPIIFLLFIIAFAVVWGIMEPEALCAAFDDDGKSFFEAMTISVYALIVPAVWLCCPFGGSMRRKIILCSIITCIAAMAIVKELDLHIMVLNAMYPDVVASFKGTPFKMKFLTSGKVPLGAKLATLPYYILLFGFFAGMLLCYARRLIVGIFKLHPVAWSIGCLGASGVMVQIFDRLPAWYRHAHGLRKNAIIGEFGSFCTAFEEGGELMIAAFALLAILQAHIIYSPDKSVTGFSDL